MRRNPFRTTYIRNRFLRVLLSPLENVADLMKAWRIILCVFFLFLCAVEVLFHRYDLKTALGCDALLVGFLAIKWTIDRFRGRGRKGPWTPPGQSPPPTNPVPASPRVPAGTAGGAATMVD